MRYNDFHCPNCNCVMSAKTTKGIYECSNCGKKYEFNEYFFRSLLMYFLILTLPYGLFNRWMRKVDFIQHKFIVSTIFVTTLALILLYSGAFRFIMEKFKVVDWKEVIENSENEANKSA